MPIAIRDIMQEKSEGDVLAKSSSSTKTRSVTFRLDTSIVDELQYEADQREISLNVLANQVLRRYRDWDRYETKMSMMPVPKVMLSTLIDSAINIAKKDGLKNIEQYRDQIVKEAARIAFDLMKDSVLYMKKSYNLWAVLSVLQDYMKVSGINSDHKIESGGRHVFIIQHELGENWSLFTQELMNLIFEKLAEVRAEISITPNTTKCEVIIR
jgi:hypothetical protein